MKMIKNIILIVFLFQGWVLNAQLKPASVFGDHMVFQREMPVPIWGKAKAGEKITVKFNSQMLSAKANKAGEWLIKLAPMKAGGPYLLEIKGRSVVVFQDIYLGEVWLCS